MMARRLRSGCWQPSTLHLFRWCLFVLVLILVRQQQLGRSADADRTGRALVSLDPLRPFFPGAAAVGKLPVGQRAQPVTDAAGRTLGFVVQTSPESDPLLGYSGPTNAVIAFDRSQKILGFAILSSGDTEDHLRAVVRDERFMRALDGLTWEQARDLRSIEGVSGATLTSLAILEGIARRLGAAPHSLRFPNPVSVAEARAFFPAADRLEPAEGQAERLAVLGADGALLGSVTRTSPASDDVIGFQGSTDTLIALDRQGRVRGIAMRDTYETEEYAGWVREDGEFLKALDGLTLEQLAVLNPQEAGIEGVSGATMTSMAMVYGAIRRAELLRLGVATPSDGYGFRSRDLGTALIVACGLLLALTLLRSSTWFRRGFQVTVILYLGWLHGEMVSQALLVGWTQHGIAWRSAPGMAVLAAAAFLAPLVTRKNVYCQQLCPHGAAQQLLVRAVPWKLQLKGRFVRPLSLIPWLLLGWVLVVALLGLPFNLASIEPFDAWLFRVAGWASLAIAAIGLAASLVVPLAYCRYGCPTGSLLNYLRRHGAGDRFGPRDLAALALLALAVALTLWLRDSAP